MPSDNQIQEEILRLLCESFEQNPGTLHISGQSLVDDVTTNLAEVDENAVVYNLERLNDDFAIDYSPSIGGLGTVSLEAGGIDKYQQLSGTIVISPDAIELVLQNLYEEERNNPRNPALSREKLLEKTQLSENSLDKVIWYLKEKYLIDVVTHLGTPWWAQAKITDGGRTAYESI